MYDFCITPIWAIVLALGGLFGFFVKGSTTSLAAGVGSAALLSLLSWISLKAFKKQQTCKSSTFVQLVLTVALTVKMYMKFTAESKVHTGALAFVGGLMCAFYVWSIGWGPVPKGAKKQT